MPRYRLDEYRFLRGRLSRNMSVWLEEIEIEEDGEISYTEKYVQISLVKLLKYLNRPNKPFSSFGVSMFEELIETCNALSVALDEKAIAQKIFDDAKTTADSLKAKFRSLQRNDAFKVNTPIIYPYKGEFYCIYSTENMTFAEKAKFYKPE